MRDAGGVPLEGRQEPRAEVRSEPLEYKILAGLVEEPKILGEIRKRVFISFEASARSAR